MRRCGLLVVTVQFPSTHSQSSFACSRFRAEASSRCAHASQQNRHATASKKIDAPLYAGTCSTRSCRCCTLRSICVSCQRDRLRGLGRIPCRPLISGARDGRIRGADGKHTEPVGLLGWTGEITFVMLVAPAIEGKSERRL